eukprot:6175519-Pleurochrysis_carterae.AAC.1
MTHRRAVLWPKLCSQDGANGSPPKATAVAATAGWRRLALRQRYAAILPHSVTKKYAVCEYSSVVYNDSDWQSLTNTCVIFKIDSAIYIIYAVLQIRGIFSTFAGRVATGCHNSYIIVHQNLNTLFVQYWRYAKIYIVLKLGNVEGWYPAL